MKSTGNLYLTVVVSVNLLRIEGRIVRSFVDLTVRIRPLNSLKSF